MPATFVSPQKETTLSAIVGRQAETHAGFTYLISGNVISIVDLDPATGQ
jgi:hypothetical protein